MWMVDLQQIVMELDKKRYAILSFSSLINFVHHVENNYVSKDFLRKTFGWLNLKHILIELCKYLLQ